MSGIFYRVENYIFLPTLHPPHFPQQSEKSAEIPTSAYTTRSRVGMLPKIACTRLKSKNPINPQFIAPIITKAHATLCPLHIADPIIQIRVKNETASA